MTRRLVFKAVITSVVATILRSRGNASVSVPVVPVSVPVTRDVILLYVPTLTIGLVHAYALYCRAVNGLEIGDSVRFYWEHFSPYESESYLDSFVVVTRVSTGLRYSDLSNDKERSIDSIWEVLIGVLRFEFEKSPVFVSELGCPNDRFDLDSHL